MQWRFLILFVVIPIYIPFLYKRCKKGAWMSVLISILSVALAVYIGLGLMLFIFQPRMIFFPRSGHDYRPEDVGLEYQSVTLTTSDGMQLDAWYIHVSNAEYTVLFCHGNAGNISHRLDTLMVFRDLGLSCLIFDYRGYGRSDGSPSEQGFYLDAHAAWNWLTQTQQIPPDKIILFGRSLGGSVAARLAADLAQQQSPPPAGLVLESCFTSVADMGKHYYPCLPVKWFVRFRFDTLNALRDIHTPVLVIHSPDDEIVPYKFGQQLYENARQPKIWASLSGSHNEGFAQDFQTYNAIWIDWIQLLKKPDITDL